METRPSTSRRPTAKNGMLTDDKFTDNIRIPRGQHRHFSPRPWTAAAIGCKRHRALYRCDSPARAAFIKVVISPGYTVEAAWSAGLALGPLTTRPIEIAILAGRAGLQAATDGVRFYVGGVHEVAGSEIAYFDQPADRSCSSITGLALDTE